jgi:DNA modification methylase
MWLAVRPDVGAVLRAAVLPVIPFVQDSDFTLYVGDVRECLRELPDESVHCVVTSPPYWGLRDYGTGAWDGGDPDCDHQRPKPTKESMKASGAERGYNPGSNFANYGDGYASSIMFADTCGKCGATRVDQQLGLEPTPEQYVANMVDVFREVRRVLRRDGTCFVNLGDSYAANTTGSQPNQEASGTTKSGIVAKMPNAWSGTTQTPVKHPFKQKDLCGIPWMVAFALRADGWYLRSDIIWAKPNPMPESVTDRPTKAHEYVFLLTRSPRYFFDQEAVREAFDSRPQQRLTANVDMPLGAARIAAGVQQGNPQGGTQVSRFDVQEETLVPHWNGIGKASHAARAAMAGQGADENEPIAVNPAGRNIRSVWEIATQPYPEAHFATFPEALPERCIKAGTSERGCCPECGAPWERETDDERFATRPGYTAKYEAEAASVGGTGTGLRRRMLKSSTTTGWRFTCQCFITHVERSAPPPDPVPCTVLDPFMGSGTVALVARRLGRRSIGIELNPEYARLCARRLQQLSLFAGATDG